MANAKDAPDLAPVPISDQSAEGEESHSRWDDPLPADAANHRSSQNYFRDLVSFP
jgi:hypothetical protein